MITKILYAWEPTDPTREFISSAINRLSSFITYEPSTKTFTKGPDALSLKAYANVTGVDGFSEQDVRVLAGFLQHLARRAYDRYKDVSIEDAPWQADILDAVVKANSAADQLLKMFYELCPNLKPIAAPPEVAAEVAQKPVEPPAQPSSTVTA